MKSNPLGKGTRNISGNVSAETYLQLEQLASLSGISMSAYLRALAEYAALKQLLAKENFNDKTAWIDAVIAGSSPLPKVRIEIHDPNSTEHGAALAVEEPAKYTAQKQSQATKRAKPTT